MDSNEDQVRKSNGLVDFLLDHPQEARRMEEKMRALGRGMFWDQVTRHYEQMFRAAQPAAQVRAVG